MSEHVLDRPLRGVLGNAEVKALGTKLDVHTVGDLLQHYPRRYATRGELTNLDELVEGEDVTIVAEVASIKKRPMQRRRGTIVEVVVTDGSGHLTLTFFNQAWRESTLVPGSRGLFAGKVSKYGRTLQLTHPEFVPLDARETRDADELANELIPVYPAAAKLPSWKIAKAVQTVLVVADDVPDSVPDAVRKRCSIINLGDAYRAIHRPNSWEEIAKAQRRLRFDEAFVLQVVLAQRRHELSQLAATPRVARSDGLREAFERRLPFTLTQGQQDIGKQVDADLAQSHPMHRLLQGEVGSGKTMIALRAMLTVVDAGGQAALLAPTEVLATQHFRSITDLLGPLAAGGMLGGDAVGTRVVLLTGSQGVATRKDALLQAVSGSAGIVIGTHALLQDHVDFFDLGLVVVDEQHRFGVEQRDALRAKGDKPPHVLVMTATPIPRTVAMTVFGDLEVSTLRELPSGRSPITTHVVPAAEKPHYVDRVWQRVREEVAAGHQVYVVAPRIGSDDDEPTSDPEQASVAATSVVRLFDDLANGPLSGLRVGMLHGRLPSDTKDDVMRRFARGDIDVLIATTVIEVGVDVANATVMVIMDADRFGVSQLHQLRGRVGRGSDPGLCLLVTQAPPGTPARDRLDHIEQTLDGFVLAQLDLQQRREGDVLGTSQAGSRSSLRLLRAITDAELIEEARGEASAVVAQDPSLKRHPLLADEVSRLVAEDRADYLDKT